MSLPNRARQQKIYRQMSRDAARNSIMHGKKSTSVREVNYDEKRIREHYEARKSRTVRKGAGRLGKYKSLLLLAVLLALILFFSFRFL